MRATSGPGDIFTQHHDGRVPPHFQANGLIDGLTEIEFARGGSGHSRSPLGDGTYTSLRRSPGLGTGLDSAKATASSILLRFEASITSSSSARSNSWPSIRS